MELLFVNVNPISYFILFDSEQFSEMLEVSSLQVILMLYVSG